MLFGRYVFTCVFHGEAFLPEYKGSTFRGVFGHALKKVVCALRREDCRECLLRSRCVYAFVFETLPPDAPLPAEVNPSEAPVTGVSRRRVAAPPHPYVIEPDAGVQTHYRPGESFVFNLLLFGRANEYLPYFIYAFDQVGQAGIGKRIAGKRGTFALQTVKAGGRTIYDRASGKISGEVFTEDLTVGPRLEDSAESVRTIKINLRTPLRLKYDNRLEATLPFHILVRAALRRVSSLCEYYGSGEPDLDYRGLVARACEVQTRASTLRWFDWQRYSNRQDQAMLMGGIVGEVTYTGALDEFVPLLRFCERAHLGKQTSFGLGRIEVIQIP